MTKPATARHSRVCWSATFAEQEKPAIDPAATRSLTYGLFLLTARGAEKENGCIVNTCVQVASEPTRLAISVQTGNLTRELIQQSGQFNVSVLTEDVPFETIRRFGMQSGRDTDKLEGFAGLERSRNGLPYLTEHAASMFSCKVLESKDLGSHVLFLGEVVESKVLSRAEPCTYAHYHAAIKPKG